MGAVCGRWIAWVGAVAVAVGVMAVAGCGKSTPTGKPVVVTAVFAYYDAARAIGGDKVEAVNLLPAGRSPHDYDPTMSDKRKVTEARLIVLNGLGLDDWVKDLAKDNKGAATLVMSTGIKVHQPKEITLGEGKKDAHDHKEGDHKEGDEHEKPAASQAGHEEHDHGHHDHGHHEGDPHIWLNPLNQIQAAQMIKDALIKLDPASKETFEKNAADYIGKIKALDAEFEAAAKAFPQKQFIGLHSAYTYLAERYGLEQVLAINDNPEAEPALGKLNQVVDTMKAKNIKVVFVENALPSKAVDRIVERTGARKLVLQPLETYDDAKNSYVELMTQNLKNLRDGLK